MCFCTISDRTRFQFLEESYQRREARLKEESEENIRQYEDRIKAYDADKIDINAGHKRRIETLEKNKQAEIERLKDLHKQVWNSANIVKIFIGFHYSGCKSSICFLNC